MSASLKPLIHSNFAAYVQYMNPSWDIPRVHHTLMNHLMSGVDCLISMPPDHAKSTISVDLYATWRLGKNPASKIVIAVGTPKLKSVVAMKIRRILESERYKAMFKVDIRKDSDGKLMFHTSAGGQFIIVSKGEGIAGIRADLIIADDLVGGAKESRSAEMRESAWTYLTMDLLTRADKGSKCQFVVIGTRWHKEDVLCRLEAHPGYKNFVNLKFKAISNDNVALWPERYSLEDLLRIKEQIGSGAFSALYQQEPTDSTGTIFKRTWFTKFYKEAPMRFHKLIISVDATFSEGEDNDYVVIHVWGKNENGYYLLDEFRKQMGYIETKAYIKAMCKRWPKAYKKVIEKKANGAALIEELNKSVGGVVGYVPTESKVARANAVAPLFEAGNVWLPDESICKWVGDYIDELVEFDKGPNDDRVDCTSQALIELRGKGDFLSAMSKM